MHDTIIRILNKPWYFIQSTCFVLKVIYSNGDSKDVSTIKVIVCLLH